MSRICGNTFTLCLSGIGCAIAAVLARTHWYSGTGPDCAVMPNGCIAAATSVHGQIGSVPTSIAGLAMYAVLLGLCLMRHTILSTRERRTAPDDRRDQGRRARSYATHKTLRLLDVIVWVIAAIGGGTSIWLQKAALYDLRIVCPWCIGSMCVVTLISFFATRDLVLDNQRLTIEQRYMAGAMVVMAGCATWLFGFDAVRKQIQSDLKPQQPVTNMSAMEPAGAIVTRSIHVMGPPNARYTIVAFLDYQCPHCNLAIQAMKNAIARRPAHYRFAIRHYPLPNHRWATEAARATEAVGEQGKFWQMSDLIFVHQDDIASKVFNASMFAKYAADLGLNVARFVKDEDCDKVITIVANDTTAARMLSVKMVPTFFIVNCKGSIYQLTGLEKMKEALNDPGNSAWR